MRRMEIVTALVGIGLGLAGCGGTGGTTTEPEVPVAPGATANSSDMVAGEGPSDPDAPEEFLSTDSGLKYRILRQGDGPQPAAGDDVTVNYRGWLDDGTEFDSSYQRGEPISFNLQQVIAGWTEGMQLVQQGGKIELEIPGDLGYGPRGSPPTIPPNATLHFIVELIDIN